MTIELSKQVEESVATWRSIQRKSYWAEHKDYLKEDWQYEVACGYTMLGYHDWVADQIVQDITMNDLSEEFKQNRGIL